MKRADLAVSGSGNEWIHVAFITYHICPVVNWWVIIALSFSAYKAWLWIRLCCSQHRRSLFNLDLFKLACFLGGGYVTVLGHNYDIFLSMYFFLSFNQDDKEAISMLEQSSQAGCLQSSYLLWEHSRKAAVSTTPPRSHCLISALMPDWPRWPVLCLTAECDFECIWVLFLISDGGSRQVPPVHSNSQGLRWQRLLGSSSV